MVKIVAWDVLKYSQQLNLKMVEDSFSPRSLEVKLAVELEDW
jgi:hypothetical protein